MAEEIPIPKFTDLSRGEHYRLVAASCLRIVIGFAVIWLVLSLVPEEPGVDLAGPIVVMVAFGAVRLVLQTSVEEDQEIQVPAVSSRRGLDPHCDNVFGRLRGGLRHAVDSRCLGVQ